MCGIVGALSLDGRPLPVAPLRAMADSVAHRGPDDAGYLLGRADGQTRAFADAAFRHLAPGLPVYDEAAAEAFAPTVFLGHRRLSIIDLSADAHQPMELPEGDLWLAYNGEVYDFEARRRELESHGQRFRSRSDTEVVLRAFARWGPDCVERLNGMFAFAAYQPRRGRVLLARDRYGIKPLYLWQRGAVLLFGSEIKSLLAFAEPEGVDLLALNEYFSFQNVLSDRTLFQGVRMLPPGHTLEVGLSGGGPPARRRYWDFRFDGSARASREALVEETLARLEAAVTRQTRADVPVGAYLSGGIDSGAITSIAARTLGRMLTFTVGFDLTHSNAREAVFDERDRAEIVASLCATEHYECVLHAGDIEAVMDELVWHLEDLRVGQCYPNFYASRLASKFAKVTLAGTGGDEVFAGYPWRYAAALAPEGTAYVDNYYHYWQRLVSNADKRALFSDDTAEALRACAGPDGTPFVDHTRTVFERVFPEAPVPHSAAEQAAQSLYFECKTFLHGLLVVEDKLSMAHSLEVRVPFLDNELVDFAQTLPIHENLGDLSQLKRMDENTTRKGGRQWGEGKGILRESIARTLPPEVVQAPKQGFSAPDESWFRGKSAEFVRERLLDPQARLRSLLRPEFVEQAVKAHQEGRENKRLLIWSLLSLETWLQTFFER